MEQLLSTTSVLGLCAGFIWNRAMWAASGLGGSYLINQSIRFNDDDLAYMTRTPSVAGNRKTWTWAGWVKRGNLTEAAGKTMFNGGVDNSNRTSLQFTGSGDTLIFNHRVAAVNTLLNTTPEFRDTAWFHLVCAVDTTQATAADRVKIIINGLQITSFGTANYPSLNADLYVNATNSHEIGRSSVVGADFDGYLADVHFIDGAALTAASFGETDAFGNWVPIEYAGTDTTTDFIPQATYSALIGNMTGLAGSLAEAFDGLHNGGLAGISSTTGYVGKDWGSGSTRNVSAYAVYSPSTTTFSGGNGGTHNLYLYGSNTGPTTPTDGTLLHTNTGVDTGTWAKVYADTGITAGDYRYTWVTIVNSASECRIGEVEFFEAGTGYGTNGFRITGEDNSTAAALGTDYSGNSNTFTTSGLTTADQMLDSPTDDAANGVGNYATLNPNSTGKLLSDGNLRHNAYTYGGIVHGHSASTIGMSSGKWWCVITYASTPDGSGAVGICKQADQGNHTTSPNSFQNTIDTNAPTYRAYGYTGGKFENGVASAAYGAVLQTLGDKVGIAYDADAGSLRFFKWVTGAWADQGVAYTGLTGTWHFGVSGYNDVIDVDFQDTSQPAGYTDYLNLCTANLPAPAIPDPSEHHQVELVTHDGTSTAFTCNWDADVYDTLFIIKNRDAAEKWYWVDGLNGYNKYLSSDATAAPTTDANVVTVSGTTITLGSTLLANGYVVECHKAGLAGGATNNDGTVTSTVSANSVSGFSIIKHDMPAGTANYTIGTGLTSAVENFFFKRTDAVASWRVSHVGLTDMTGYYLALDTTAAQANSAGVWGVGPSATTIGMKADGMAPASTAGLLIYAWHGTSMSSFGSYVGNGSADGPMVTENMLPETFTTKCVSNPSAWHTSDTKRSTYNVTNTTLNYDTTAADYTHTAWNHDLLSAGVKFRSLETDINRSAGVFIYCMWGGTPIQGDGTDASQGRAR